jgi:hypothetical protein
MRIFVAGATGAVGRLLIPLLTGAGHQVTGTSRTPHGLDRVRALGADAVQVNAFDTDGLRDAVTAAAPDVVIHQLTALAEGNTAENSRIRREGTRNLVDAAKQAGVTRIIAQSVAWAYAPGNSPADEHTPLDLTAPPPRANLIGGIRALEETAAELKEHVILRYGTFYGPGTWYSPGGLVDQQLRQGSGTTAARRRARDARSPSRRRPGRLAARRQQYPCPRPRLDAAEPVLANRLRRDEDDLTRVLTPQTARRQSRPRPRPRPPERCPPMKRCPSYDWSASYLSQPPTAGHSHRHPRVRRTRVAPLDCGSYA